MQPTTVLDGTYTLQDETDNEKPVYKNVLKCSILRWNPEPGKVGWHIAQCYPERNFVERTKYYAKR